MAKTVKLRLLDALEAIASINRFTGSLPLDDFLGNEMFQAAVLIMLGVIGEALNNATELDDSLREAIPDLGKIIGLRNRIAGEVPGSRRERMICKHHQIAENLRRLGYDF
jgi:uncharacterized protein with HEPN domain